ncbi:MAG: barstar family protein [Clostridiales bacterium]|nr:barstar family protein [Clostridiales bacterium]
MREITLNLTPFEEKISLHRYLKETLDFPFYYGANLDALHDELTSEVNNLHITLCYPENPKGKMVEYLPRLLRVFEDAARENYHLNITYQKIEE